MGDAAGDSDNLVLKGRLAAVDAHPEASLGPERLKLWYATADAGYHTRNQMVPEQFSKMITLYQVFITMLVAFALWVQSPAAAASPGLKTTAPFIALLLEVSGLFCMLAMHLDLCSTLSAKYSMQAYLEDWDGGAAPTKGPRQVVSERPTYREESLKHVLAAEWGQAKRCWAGSRARRAQFVVVSRVLIMLWIATSCAVSFWIAGIL
ncbi:MAG TPA: hypothetical protein VM286_08550 [Candidatus Thermoplasmatota archaeon]|nr:hypothetical protein [Candidatus Thermoplasmatota archaeon]